MHSHNYLGTGTGRYISKSPIAMAGGQKLYPRATVKKIVKAHSKHNVTKNVDVLVSVVDASPQNRLLMAVRYFSTTLCSYKRTRSFVFLPEVPIPVARVCGRQY